MSKRKSFNLNVSARSKFADMAENNIISGKVVADILRATSNNELLKAISSMYDLSAEKQMLLWYHIITCVWKNDDKQTWFGDTECFFMRELVFNNGVLKKTACMKIKALFTEHKTTNTAQNLQEMGLIHIFTINREVLYVLSGEFYEEVFSDER